MDITIGGDTAHGAHPDAANASSNPETGAQAFLARYPTAKIVVVVDTHCLDSNGAFVYTGDSPDTYLACVLPTVSIRFASTAFPV